MRSATMRRLERAKKAADHLSDGGKRKWLISSVMSYGDEQQQTCLHVMEGSPPRAFIVEQPSRGFATLLDMEGRYLGTVTGGDYEPVRWKPSRKARSV